MTKTPSIIALIPARSSSKRIIDKNIKKLVGHPLLAYTISSAIDSEIFTRVIVSTDSPHYAEISQYYGAEVPFLRPKEFATSTSPDIEWLHFTLEKLQDKQNGKIEDCFALLRPTSPARTSKTIKRAWKLFLDDGKADSLRAVEICSQHPAKMWLIDEKKNRMHPVMVNPDKKDTPWHSQQYPSLPKVYTQNACLEIAWTRLPLEQYSISGDTIMPFFTNESEGFDLNFEEDWIIGEKMLKEGKLILPKVKLPPYKK